jgi:integrase
MPGLKADKYLILSFRRANGKTVYASGKTRLKHGSINASGKSGEVPNEKFCCALCPDQLCIGVMLCLQERICTTGIGYVLSAGAPKRKESLLMGVYRRDKTWYISYQDPNGKLVRKSTRQESKKTAEKILAKLQTEMAEGKYLDKQEKPLMTFSDLCDWYWTHHGQHLKSSGINGMLKRLGGYFGDTRLTAISPENVIEYVQHRKSLKKLSPSTVNRDIQLLKSMFNLVITYKRWKKVLENPVCYVKLDRENNQRVRYLDKNETDRFLACCKDHLRPIVFLALRTGMRQGEIFRMRWSDVDLKKRQILIPVTKSGESRRAPISNDLLEMLLSLPSRLEGGHVFPSNMPRYGSSSGKGPTDPYVDVKNSFRHALNLAGIEDFRFHDLRHTFASHLVMQGVDLNTVRELLGHKSLVMTLRYSHLSPGHNHEAISKIDKALGPMEKHTSDTPSDTVDILRINKTG